MKTPLRNTHSAARKQIINARRRGFDVPNLGIENSGNSNMLQSDSKNSLSGVSHSTQSSNAESGNEAWAYLQNPLSYSFQVLYCLFVVYCVFICMCMGYLLKCVKKTKIKQQTKKKKITDFK